MHRIAVTGSHGFIGSAVVARARGRFAIRRIFRKGASHSADSNGALVDFQDQSSIQRALSGCDGVIHCGHDGVAEENNAPTVALLLRAAQAAGVRAVVIMGSFAIYDGMQEKIIEAGRQAPFLLKYLQAKRDIIAAGEAHADQCRSQIVTVLEPAIVEGDGGSWDRFRRMLTRTPEIYLPFRGAGVCNRIAVERVAEASLRAVSRSLQRSFSSGPNFERFLLADRQPITWREWVAGADAVQALRINGCNRNLLSADLARNLALSVKYYRPWDLGRAQGAWRFGLAGARFRGVGEFGLERRSLQWFSPEGLNRLTFYCQARVDPGKALDAGLLD